MQIGWNWLNLNEQTKMHESLFNPDLPISQPSLYMYQASQAGNISCIHAAMPMEVYWLTSALPILGLSIDLLLISVLLVTGGLTPTDLLILLSLLVATGGVKGFDEVNSSMLSGSSTTSHSVLSCCFMMSLYHNISFYISYNIYIDVSHIL